MMNQRWEEINNNNDGALMLKLSSLAEILERTVDEDTKEKILNQIWMEDGCYDGSILVGARTLGKKYLHKHQKEIQENENDFDNI